MINVGITIENKIPLNIPVMRKAAPNMPAVAAYCGSTDLKSNFFYFIFVKLHSQVLLRYTLEGLINLTVIHWSTNKIKDKSD